MSGDEHTSEIAPAAGCNCIPWHAGGSGVHNAACPHSSAYERDNPLADAEPRAWGHWCYDQVPVELPAGEPRCPQCGAIRQPRKLPGSHPEADQ